MAWRPPTEARRPPTEARRPPTEASRRPNDSLRLLGPGLGRQLFALFLGCALLPVLILSMLSWARVGEELEAQARVRLHHAARRTGMVVLDRLTSTEALLAKTTSRTFDRMDADELERRITRLVLDGDADQPFIGDPGPAPPVAGAQADPRRSRLLLQPSQPNAPPDIWLRVPIERGARHWLARLDPRFVFDVSHENSLPPAGEACIVAASGQKLWSSMPGLECAPAASRTGTPSLRTLEIGEEPYLALDWLLFLDASFQDAGWTILVTEPEGLAMAPVETFRTLVLLVSALTFSIVAFLSARQIRRQLRPLASLEAAATRVRAGEFNVAVPVESNDELGRVSLAFNQMSEHLSEQFSSLEQLIEMDRTILSATNRSDLVSAALDAVAQVASSDVVGLAFPDRFDLGGDDMSVYRREAGRPDEVLELPRRLLTAADWYDESKSLMRVASRRIEPELREVLGTGDAAVELYPLLVERQCLGFVFRQSMVEDAQSPTGPLRLRQLCDQIASAIHGITLRSKNEMLLRFDSQTGLPNFRSHEEDLVAAVEGRGGQSLTAIHIAITGLSRHAKAHGPGRAEAVVRCIAEGLRSIEGIQPARIAGASFGAFFAADDMDGIMSRIRSISSTLRRHLEGLPGSHGLGIVIGTAVYGLDGDVASSLIHKAEIAAQHSTAVGSDSIAFFSDQMEKSFRRSSELEASLEHAIEAGELHLEYQPIVDAATRMVVAAEALVRWTCPVRGPIAPDVFVPIAEECGLIHPLGEWVLKRAFEDVQRWRSHGVLPVRISVNVSASQVEPSLCEQIEGLLESTDVRPEDIGIELTESAVLGESATAQEVIGRIRSLGLKVSIDDFGTGYSSLDYLRRFEVDVVKIDRSFLQGVPDDPGDCSLTRAAIAVGRALGLRTVAEGCETEAQLAFLREAGCDQVQGYLFAAPMVADDLEKMMTRANRGDGQGAVL